MSWNGVLLIDKSEGPTSHDVVSLVRRGLNMSAVGHAGTLDPMASGLLVILLGEATKLSDFLLQASKQYLFTTRLGWRSETLDLGCDVVEKTDVSFDTALIHAKSLELQGAFEWEVPAFSAMKVEGKKLYEYARQGEKVPVRTKLMDFNDLKVVATTPSNVTVQVTCSKGSFVRAWARELGTKLEVPALVENLRRLSSGSYRVEQAIKLDEFSELCKKNEPEDLKAQWAAQGSYIKLEQCLPHLRDFAVADADERLIVHGQISQGLKVRLLTQDKLDENVKVTRFRDGSLLCVLQKLPDRSAYKIRRVFPVNRG